MKKPLKASKAPTTPKARSPLGPLAPLDADPAVSEVFVDGPNRVSCAKRGRITDTGLTLTATGIERICTDVLAATVGGKFHKGITMFDVRLADGGKFVGILPPLSVNGPSIGMFPA